MYVLSYVDRYDETLTSSCLRVRSDAGWNIIGTILVWLFMPETKALTLEELDQVFSVPTKKHAAYHIRQLPYNFRRYILRQDVGPKEELYHWITPEEANPKSTYVEKGAQRA